MKFSVFQVSRKGGRETNEDCMGYCYTSDAALLILADGMGGHPEGEVASRMALQVIAEHFQRQAVPQLADVAVFLERSLLAAHEQILLYARRKSMADSPRTTIVMAVVQNGCVMWTHCGDSRLYMVRNGRLLARTKDHSMVEQQASRGRPRDATALGDRNVLFTCLGSAAKPIFNVFGPLPLQKGDRLMLCSDGMWSVVSQDDLLAALSRQPVDRAVPDLVEKALRQGGSTSDNVTCLAFEWEMTDDFEATCRSELADPESATDSRFASLVQGDLTVAPRHFDAASIERTSAEINDSNRRVTAGRQ